MVYGFTCNATIQFYYACCEGGVKGLKCAQAYTYNTGFDQRHSKVRGKFKEHHVHLSCAFLHFMDLFELPLGLRQKLFKQLYERGTNVSRKYLEEKSPPFKLLLRYHVLKAIICNLKSVKAQ